MPEIAEQRGYHEPKLTPKISPESTRKEILTYLRQRAVGAVIQNPVAEKARRTLLAKSEMNPEDLEGIFNISKEETSLLGVLDVVKRTKANGFRVRDVRNLYGLVNLGYKNHMEIPGQEHVCNATDKSALGLYLKDIAPNDLLSKQEEASLARRIREGDYLSFDKLVTSNLRFAITIAKEYQGRGLPLEDLIGEGNLGLVHAAARFNESRGVKFTTYAVWWIRQAILAALAEQARMVRLPVNKIKHLLRLEKTARRLNQDLGREPSTEELAEETDMSVRQVWDLRYVSRGHLSLDTPETEDGKGTLQDILYDQTQFPPDEQLEQKDLFEQVETTLLTLSKREQEVIKLYFGIERDEPMTLEEIGKQLGLTKERIRQIRDKAINALKHPSRINALKEAV